MRKTYGPLFKNGKQYAIYRAMNDCFFVEEMAESGKILRTIGFPDKKLSETSDEEILKCV